MNTNQIKTDGFSNPDTERLFQGFTEERVIQDAEEENYCGFCTAAWFLNPKDAGWIFCLSEDSPYRFETLDSSFTCPHQNKCSAVDPGEEPEEPRTTFRSERNGTDLGLGGRRPLW